jgi:uncharacterized membrane protein YqjE
MENKSTWWKRLSAWSWPKGEKGRKRLMVAVMLVLVLGATVFFWLASKLAAVSDPQNEQFQYGATFLAFLGIGAWCAWTVVTKATDTVIAHYKAKARRELKDKPVPNK